ncbi:hypothetical protein [Thermogemmatispora sp.]|uniref:hypothetical protein n=1 Tax=Thermogemmatispora sp. TaxID=1968838 RepID=UPI0035E41103
MLGRPQGPRRLAPAGDNHAAFVAFMVTLFLTVTIVVVFSTLMPAASYRQSCGLVIFLLVPLIVSLNLEQPGRTIVPEGYLVFMFICLGFSGVALLVILAERVILLLVAPWIVVLLSLVFARGGGWRFWRRLLLGIGIVLFLMLLGLADLRGLWWQPLLLSLVSSLPVLVAVGWGYRRNPREGLAISCLLSGLVGVLSCGLGAIGLAQSHQLERGLMTTFVGILATSLAGLVETLRARMLVWVCVLLFLLGISYPFVAHTPLNDWLALGSGLLLVAALLGIWRLEISRPSFPGDLQVAMDPNYEDLYFPCEEEEGVDEPENG